MTPMPLWKRLFILLVCGWGILSALPNIFYSRVESYNDAVALVDAGSTLDTAQEAELGLWSDWLPSSLVNLGLDLRGGAHLLAEVQVTDVYQARMDQLWPEVRNTLRNIQAQTGGVRRQPSPAGTLRVSIANIDAIPAALSALNALASPVANLVNAGESDLNITNEGATITIELSDAEKSVTDLRTVKQSLEIIRRRVDEVGTREPTIQRQGEDRILIQVPGLGSAAELKALIGTTAKLTFNPVVGRTRNANERPGPGNQLLPSVDEPGLFYVIEQTPVVTGETLVDAQPSFDERSRSAVSFRFSPTGARAFGDYTAANIGAPFAIVLDNEVISAPTIQSHIAGGSGIITGSFSVEEATQLAILLRAGALPAKLEFLEERTIGPELGQDSIEAGRIAALAAMGAVLVLMILSYGLMGTFAALALVVNVALIFAVLSLIGATLTLPGIAGIVLTIGMAVDANVLVFERIREELKTARSVGRAIDLGYEKAKSAIIDANITTMITALVLFMAGSGPVRGFAITLGIGILTSVFTALFVTRLIVDVWFTKRRPKTLTV